MDLLEMPLEDIVLRFHSLPAAVAAGSLCAGLAVLAAALGLWRIRAVGSRSDVSLPHSPTPPKPEPAQAPAPAPAPVPRSPEPTARALHCHVEDAGTPKARFTAYYGSCDRFDVEDDGDEQAEVDNGRKNDGASLVRARLTAPIAPLEGFGWEGLMVRRRGDLGWYRYQDLTALNGSVVRLWDGDSVWTATSRRRSPMGL
ncbi:uncharacterized protein LOC103716956 [Phoenix dactylifera]|uniref:Uncharacterized protein LOC103716956 n=1 Tax=Phoenix dactylifera TaxID=42345 RepID=A0A8B7CP94_PHODC|nr:uncharacterized protein LOC103716956 [Phoenix dactylifera]